jgi:hypothetical protein
MLLENSYCPEDKFSNFRLDEIPLLFSSRVPLHWMLSLLCVGVAPPIPPDQFESLPTRLARAHATSSSSKGTPLLKKRSSSVSSNSVEYMLLYICIVCYRYFFMNTFCSVGGLRGLVSARSTCLATDIGSGSSILAGFLWQARHGLHLDINSGPLVVQTGRGNASI